MSSLNLELDSDQFFTFLPKSWIPENPKYLVWYTGTLGQAEWLITHSEVLRGNSIPLERNKNFKRFIDEWPEIAERMSALFALEDPDLVISDQEGTPLMSIEITEQQPFG